MMKFKYSEQDWIYLAQNGILRWALVNAVMNLQAWVQYIRENSGIIKVQYFPKSRVVPSLPS
jgi:hypothetical protein